MCGVVGGCVVDDDAGHTNLQNLELCERRELIRDPVVSTSTEFQRRFESGGVALT